MPHFLLRVTAFLALQGVVFALLYRPDMPRQDNYLAANLDKHRRLAAARPPRIILLGGSNVAFGMDSALLAALTGRPVVNMGLVSPLGAELMLNEVAAALGPGDVVILLLEYDQYRLRGSPLTRRQMLEFRPGAWRHVPADFRRGLLLDDGLAILGAVVRRSWLATQDAVDPASLVYRRAQVNAAGDYVDNEASAAHQPAPGTPGAPGTTVKAAGLNPRVRARLESFAVHAAARDAAFLVSWPAVARWAFDPSAAAIHALRAELAAIPGVTLLGEPEDFVFDDAWRYDVAYHLVREGARWRTRVLAERLRAHGLPATEGAATKAP